PFSNIYGAYLKRSGTGELVVEKEIPVYTGNHFQEDPSITYNGNSGQFAVTWIDIEEERDSICGVLVNDAGPVSQEEAKLIAGEPDDSAEQYYYLSTVYNPVLPDGYFSVWFRLFYQDEESSFGAGQQSNNSLVPSGSSYDFGDNIYNAFDPKLDAACNTNEGNYLVAYPCIHRYPVEYPDGDIRPKADTTINNCYIKWELIGEAHENPGIIQFKVDDVIDGYDYFEGDCIYYGVDESHGILEIPVERFGGFSGEVTVTYDVYGNARDPWDYEILGDYPTFSGSESEEMIRIRIIDDDVVDPGKYIELLIYDAEDAELGDIIRAKIYIDDNDSATVKFSSSSYTVAENVYENTGKNYSEIKVLFSGFRPIEASKLFSSYEWEEEETVFSVVYETFDGTASEGEDYTAVSGLLHFGGEAGERTFRVPIIDDNKDEANETVILRLSFPGQEAQSSGEVEGDTLWIGGSPVTLGTPKTATLTITDDDTAPSRPNDKKDKDKPSVVEPPKETPPPVEGLSDNALVDRMPGYIVLSTPVKINTVRDEISLSCNTDKLAGNPGHDARIYYWNPEVSKWVALATYPDGSGKVKAINDGGYKGWFVVFGVIQPHFADIN
ncbi:MAG TPA: Calx-beta domain-containing protein, partial [Bacillota bacterium]|nr:Calx-beta domain-containing protein [Bacillota bacterium]